MPFTGKDQHSLGTSSWQSDHYLAFTRLSLFHFAPLDSTDPPEAVTTVIAAFKRVRVVWFCLMASIFAEEKVSSARIDNYVKLFLSSCRTLSILSDSAILTKDAKEGDMKEDENNEFEEKKKDKKGKGKNTKKTKAPFFISGSNYLSLLNLKNMKDDSGDLRDTYEGLDEGYIQNIKREFTTMRHTTEFLANILRKLLVTCVFTLLNEDNPNGQQKQYERNYDIKIYRCRSDQMHQNILEHNDVLVGGVDKIGNLFLCLKDSLGIRLYSLRFDDEDGYWCLNLWYSKVRLGPVIQTCHNRKELDEKCIDYFIMLSRPIQDPSLMDPIPHRTVICRSWRIRDENGRLRLPVPTRKILFYDIRH